MCLRLPFFSHFQSRGSSKRKRKKIFNQFRVSVLVFFSDTVRMRGRISGPPLYIYYTYVEGKRPLWQVGSSSSIGVLTDIRTNDPIQYTSLTSTKRDWIRFIPLFILYNNIFFFSPLRVSNHILNSEMD